MCNFSCCVFLAMFRVSSLFCPSLVFLLQVSHSLSKKECIKGFVEQSEVNRRHHQDICCPGYSLHFGNNGVNCKPICIPACRNGTCQTPGVCACNPGFKSTPTQPNICTPHCSDGCIHGTCIAPEMCYCDHGYEYNLESEVCDPVCTEPCVNGTCASPENCVCFSGYRKSESNICKPYCSVGCEHGHCVGPDTCDCEPGWGNLNYFGICKPICTDCYDGICLAPEICIRETESTETSVLTTEVLEESTASLLDEWTDPSPEDPSMIVVQYDQSNILIILGAILLIASILIIAVLILKWLKVFDYMLGRSYVVDDKDADINMDSVRSS